MIGRRTLHTRAVGADHDDSTRLAQRLDDPELDSIDAGRAKPARAFGFNAVALRTVRVPSSLNPAQCRFAGSPDASAARPSSTLWWVPSIQHG